jgi:hypothetical protein
MFQSKTSTAWQPHPALAAIRDDDPELQGILAGIRSPVSSMNQIIDAGPHKKTVIYDHLRSYDENQDRETGLLKTWTSMGRRHAFALDHAKYLLVLKIIGEKKEPKTPNAPCPPRPRRN